MIRCFDDDGTEFPSKPQPERCNRLNAIKQNYKEIHDQDNLNLSSGINETPPTTKKSKVTDTAIPAKEHAKTPYGAKMSSQTKNLTKMYSVTWEVSQTNAWTSRLRAEAKVLQFGVIPDTQH